MKNILVDELCYIFIYIEIEIVIVALFSGNFGIVFFAWLKSSNILIFNLYIFGLYFKRKQNHR